MYLSSTVCICPTGTEDDLEYYVRECGNILGVTQKLDSDSQSAKHVLGFIFERIVEFKKFNQVRQRDRVIIEYLVHVTKKIYFGLFRMHISDCIS